VMAMGCTNTGSRAARRAWCICSARPGAWRSAHRPSGPLVELGHVPSYNASAIGPRLHPRAESGGRGRHGSVSGLPSITTAPMRPGGLPAA
jgi:hypothetical protein